MKASIIICTYNEQKTISKVIKRCCKFNPEHEIIIVDDGSTDKTYKIISNLEKDYSFRYERLKQNMGKSHAMAHGVEKANYPIILFFDADVTGIRKIHFEHLLSPLVNNEADMVLGPPSDTFIDYRLNPFKSLTGQRAMLKQDILPLLDDIRDVQFGVETYINLYFQANGKRVQFVELKGLKHPTKFSKTSPVQATKELLSEGKEIMLTLLSNYDLVLKRIGLQLKDKDQSAGQSDDKLAGKEGQVLK